MEKSNLDILWLVLSAGLVSMMQPGFAALESGLTRSKNSINVAVKNITDMGVSIICYWCIGFGLMYGTSTAALIGGSKFFPDLVTPWDSAFFLYQAMFCATAATIVSGAVAERMRYRSYVIATILIGGFIYPVLGHWVWSAEGGGGWLKQLGFVDFAGSSVVHSLGGWIGLAGVIVIGPRTGRFTKDGESRTITGSNLPFAIMGVFLLFFGWIGFNGGSTFGFDDRVPGILTNTTLAAVGGCIGAMLLGNVFKKQADAGVLINGVLSGLVSITAGCHLVGAGESIIIGAIGGFVMLTTEQFLINRKVDDAVGAFGVHAAAGIWGTLAVALFGNLALLENDLSRLDFLGIQAIGVLAVAAWSFGFGFLLFKVMDFFDPIRVSAEDEKVGLNIAEHGATTEIIDLFRAMEQQKQTGDMSIRVPVEPFTEVGQIAYKYNEVMENLEKTVGERDSILGSINDGLFILHPDKTVSKIQSRALSEIFGVHDLGGQVLTNVLQGSVPESVLEEAQSFLNLLFNKRKDEQSINLLNPMEQLPFLNVKNGVRSHLQFTFKRLFDEEKTIAGLLVVVRDITKQVELAEQLKTTREEGRRETELMVSVLKIPTDLLRDFLTSAQTELENIDDYLRENRDDLVSTLQDIFRAVHTIKGNAQLISFELFAEKAHDFEEKLKTIMDDGDALTGKDLLPVTIAFEELTSSMSRLNGIVDKFKELSTNNGLVSGSAVLSALITSIKEKSLELSAQYEKHIEIIDSGLDLSVFDENQRDLIKDVLIQLTRNSIVHGIERSEDRIKAGKQAAGRIEFESKREANYALLMVRDDGVGLNLKKLREQALASGKWPPEEIAAWTTAKIAKLIYEPGISTAGVVDHSAGRGIGMDLIRQKIKSAGGKIQTRFAPGRFCEFLVQLPA